MNVGGRVRGAARIGGFTLIEMLVVIVIIAILASIALAIVSGIMTRTRATRTEGLIKLLSSACDNYWNDFKKYPPGQGSRALHQGLGSPRRLAMIQDDAGTIYRTMPPLIEFRAGQLERGAPSLMPPPASAIIDAWDQEIQYLNPGVNRKKAVDIWSDGPKNNTREDDIGNWVTP